MGFVEPEQCCCCCCLRTGCLVIGYMGAERPGYVRAAYRCFIGFTLASAVVSFCNPAYHNVAEILGVIVFSGLWAYFILVIRSYELSLRDKQMATQGDI